MTAVFGQSDAELVVQSLAGNRDAFGQIVLRYQSLVCSLAYSATGSVAQSEDLAQDTFVAAWKHLASLREPEKLCAWLCGIARNLINNWRRRQGREPSHGAEPLEAIAESAASEPLPMDQTISHEEEVILWHSLERIPEIYREPLVLFYREHQSAGRVAQALELSEDAVHQRLSRGRKLLQEQVLSFVEGTLERTRPGKAFTLGVLAALPLLATTAKAATATVAIKGGSTVKAVSSFAMLGAVLTASVLFVLSLLGFLIFTGACIGYMMGRACLRSANEFNNAIKFWRTLAAGFWGIVVPMVILKNCIPTPALYHTWLRPLTWIVALFYPLFLTALIVWIVRWWHGLRHPDTETEAFGRPLKKRFAVWFTLGLVLPAFLSMGFLYSALFQSAWTTQYIRLAQAQQIITSRKDAQVTVDEYANGYKGLWIKLPENGRRLDLYTQIDDATLALLAKSGLTYHIKVEGVDFVEDGKPWGFILLLSIFITSTGGTVLVQRPWKYPSFSKNEAEIRRDERIAKGAFKAFAVCVALVLLAAGILLGLMSTKIWSARYISNAEAQKIVPEFAGLKGSRFEVFQYANGSSELWISRERHPDYIAPADTATLSLLKEKGIAFKTYIQGKDFGYAMPGKATSLVCVLILIIGAGMILWWITPKTIAVLLALIMLAVCVMLGLMTPWHFKSVSATEARLLIIEHKAAGFEVYQYKNGLSQLIITPRGRVRRHGSIAGWRAFVAPATDSTLALLATNKIPYRTYIQGRDFGYGVPGRGASFLWISFLTMGAAGLLWWVIKKPHRLAKPA